MNIKEKLMDLLHKSTDIEEVQWLDLHDMCQAVEEIADYLISHGVTVQECHSAENLPKEDGTYLVQTKTGTITTARFYAFKSFPATKYLPAFHRSACWQSNRNVVRWTYLPQPPEFDK